MNPQWQDLRYGARMLARNPGFTSVAVLTLALGIGANTTIFSVVNAVLLRPLPFSEPDRLVNLDETNPGLNETSLGVSYANFVSWRESAHVFESLGAYRPASSIFAASDGPIRVPSAFVTASMFQVLRVAPASGRVFNEADDAPGAPAVAMVSEGFSRRRMGGGADAVGRSIVLNGRSRVVVGVMGTGFQFPTDATEIWLPLGPSAQEAAMTNRAVHLVDSIGRLKDGVTVADAGREMANIARRLQEQYPGADPGHGLAVRGLHEVVVGKVQTSLLVLLGAVGFVLLIACVNVANLLLARASVRQKEMAIRTALGAGRGRVVRLLLTESLLLAFLGSGAGLLIAMVSSRWLLAQASAFVPRAAGIGIDGTVLLFAAFLAVLTGTLFGLVPAIQASRPDLTSALKASGPSVSGPGRGSFRGALVVAEVALCLVLLAGAGLMMKSLWRLQAVDPGFVADHLLTVSVSLPEIKYREDGPVVSFYRELPQGLLAIPGVSAVSAVSNLPISGGDGQGELTIDGQPFPPGGAPAASFRRTLPNYFSVMGIPLKEGREFDERDTGASKVVIINESFARRFWPAGDAVGKRIKVGPAESESWLTIVGVTGDVRNVGLDAGPGFATYEPLAQRPRWSMSVVIRTAIDPLSVIPAVRQRIREAEKDVLIGSVSTFDQRLASSFAPRRFNLALLSAFATLALLLAAIGIYGVMAYALNQRTREIGIRMALGARSLDILGLATRQGMTLIVLGVGIGLVAALSLTRVLSSMLFGVTATDPATFVAISLLLTVVGLVACSLPARRASRVDPMVALRCD